MSEEGAEFYFADGLRAALGDSVERWLPAIIEQGVVIEERDGAFLLAWPTQEHGIIAYIRAAKNAKSNAEFVAAWPFARTGRALDICIRWFDGDHDNPDIVLAHCAFGDVGFSAFDTFCLASYYQMSVGLIAVRAYVHGWAVKLELPSTQPIVLLPDQVSASVREAFAERFEQDGKVTIETKQMAALLPYRKESTPLHEIRGVVQAVSEEKEMLSLSFITLIVTVARQDDGTPMDIEITVSSEVWQGEWPKVGNAVRGLIWLQAIFDEPS
ncbi:hypothetical protein GGR44_002524 [Sphingobium fontiphilum]|uniref:Uncharacterized protein n=1 Tax=Sphingobium fontiphilum TaxID=944425 RepID=A0A7W6DPP4_9SPHN|nr:hypothetical protein [Sphingobium fontiphilum]MBB3982844.1 hypothetical protein [Sphingobium fontiphilum]